MYYVLQGICRNIGNIYMYGAHKQKQNLLFINPVSVSSFPLHSRQQASISFGRRFFDLNDFYPSEGSAVNGAFLLVLLGRKIIEMYSKQPMCS